MKSQELQRLVKQIFGDEKSKAQFISDPESVMSQFSLTDQEKRAVLKTHTKLGLVGSGSTSLAATMDPLTYWW